MQLQHYWGAPNVPKGRRCSEIDLLAEVKLSAATSFLPGQRDAGFRWESGQAGSETEHVQGKNRGRCKIRSLCPGFVAGGGEYCSGLWTAT